MTIDAELKSLVCLYAKYDEEKKCYINNPNIEMQEQLKINFDKLLDKLLLKDGPDKRKIESNYRKLALYFHPDRKNIFLPEVVWLEENLSDGISDTICFKSLSLCYEKLTAPEHFKPIQFDEINSLDDLEKWLVHLRQYSRSYTERTLYESLLGLLHESCAYYDEIGAIRPNALKKLVSFLPVVFLSFGYAVFAEELFSVYALYFVLLKGGQYLSTNNSRDLKKLGNTLQKMSIISATATTTLLVRLSEMTFWASRQCYDMSLQIGATLITPLLHFPTEKKHKYSAPDEMTNLCRDLILVSQHSSKKTHFKTPQLKMIAAPIESCIGLLEQQFFRNWRVGGEKHRELNSFLLRMRVFDKDDTLSIEEKIIQAQKALDLVKKNEEVYVEGSRTALAIDQAERVINLLKGEYIPAPFPFS